MLCLTVGLWRGVHRELEGSGMTVNKLHANRVGEGSLASVPLHTIAYPVLFVHHREDPCTSFEAAYRQHRRLIESSRVNFIEVLGGDQSRAIGCKPRDPGFGLSWAHGFSGKEREVIRAITDWVTGKPVPDRIGP